MLEIRSVYIFLYKFPVNHQKPYLYGRNKNHTIIDDYYRKDEKFHGFNIFLPKVTYHTLYKYGF